MNNNNLVEKIGGIFDFYGPHSNLDIYYGPYTTKEEAYIMVPEEVRDLGLTVGIIEFIKNPNGTYIHKQLFDSFTQQYYYAYVNDPDSIETKYSISGINEYQWKKGKHDSELELKVDKFNLTIANTGEAEFSVDEGNIIQISYSVTGRATVAKGYLYQVIGNTEIFIGDFTNIGKGNNSQIISNPTTSGVYTYRLKILDSSGTYATTDSGEEYLEYVVRYGGISVSYNFLNINRIQIKNAISLAEKTFNITINVRDDSFNILQVALCDYDEQNLVALNPYDNLSTISDSYLGTKIYYLPEEEVLNQFNDKNCYIKISYTEDGQQYVKKQFAFTLLDLTSLTIVPETVSVDYYVGIPSSFRFQLKSGVENISVVLNPNANSDFLFKSGTTVQSYKSFSLSIIPKEEKINANLIMDYSFILDNRTIYGTLTVENVGNIVTLPDQTYYEPTQGEEISLYKIVDANINNYDLNENGHFIKIINSPISVSYSSCSFILDMYCKINQTSDTNIKYLTIKYGDINNSPICYITEDEIYSNGMITDTPLNEWFQVGIGINLFQEITRAGETRQVMYHAIYINGMIVKNIKIDGDVIKPIEYDPNKNLIVELSNGILVQKCFLYYNSLGTNSIFPNTDTTRNNSIIYNNYKSHNFEFSEPENLPVLKLSRITDIQESNHYFELINSYKDVHGGDKLVHTTIFGEIGSQKATNMNAYDPEYNTFDVYYHPNATLFRQHVDIKKPAQKEYAVLCTGEWIVNNENVLNGVVIEVHTQGTSTLVYSVPNFKFTFWKTDSVTGEWEHFCPPFIKKNNNNEETDQYYNEYIYTAKCDYMDSSHLNNTPTCIFYNNTIQRLIDLNKISGSPSAIHEGIDAILGFPIIMEINDGGVDGSNDYYTNIGSFMLNIDKTGDSLGFEVDDQGNSLSCFSLEGTSNDDGSGAAGRFIIPDEVVMIYNNTGTSNSRITLSNGLKSYANLDGTIDENSIDTDYADASTYIQNHTTEESILNCPYVQWCNFFSQGLEYRYPDSDIYKEKSNKVSKILKLNDFKRLYRMWHWVNESDNYDNAKYRTEFPQYFNLDYCKIYFIQLMIFGQTDNLGKNAMFDTWGDSGIWYPRPYDLDSQAGLDNNGVDNIAPFVEIRPEFSLDYRVNYTEEQLEENNLLPNSVIHYGTQNYDRYHYSSSDSKLWINFYKNYQNDIRTLYYYLRTTIDSNTGFPLYSPDNIINLCDINVITPLGINQYNQDFNNKYLGNDDQRLAYGNRWYKFKKWITRRFAFCDSYFGTTDSSTYDVERKQEYYITVDSPQYVTQTYQGGGNIQFVLSTVRLTPGGGAGTKITLNLNQRSVLDTSLFKFVTIASGNSNYQNLLNIDVSDNSKIQTITELTGSTLLNVKNINISNSGVNYLNVPQTTKTLKAQYVTLTSLTFDTGCLVESIDMSSENVSKVTIVEDPVSFSDLPNLSSLNLTNCIFRGNVTFANLPSLEDIIITNTQFQGGVTFGNGIVIQQFNFSNLTIKDISFSGSDLNIKKLEFRNTTFTTSTLNLNAISSNIEYLDFYKCKGLTHLQVNSGYQFNSLNYFGLRDSSIKSLGENNTYFDASSGNTGIFPNGLSGMNGYHTVASNGKITYYKFRFIYTKIEKIKNINWVGSGNQLFAFCSNLTSIEGKLELNTNIDQLFYNCKLLTTVPTGNNFIISTNSEENPVTSATYAFAETKNLPYSVISSTIQKCELVTDFSHACRCTKFASGQVINLNTLFVNNEVVTKLDYMFCGSDYNSSNLTTVNNSLIIQGTIPLSVTSTNCMFDSVKTVSIPYNIISEAKNLQTATAMFYTSSITFTGNNLPTVTDSDTSVVTTLTNAVDKWFFPIHTVEIEQDNNGNEVQVDYPKLKTISALFGGTSIKPVDDEIFSNLINLENCNYVFGSGTARKFSYTYQYTVDEQQISKTVDLDLNVKDLWKYNPKLKNIAGCFRNVCNVYCTTLLFHNNITSQNEIDISGLFGLGSIPSGVTPRDISIDIDGIVPKLKCNCSYDVPHAGSLQWEGTFERRKVYVTVSEQKTSIFNRLRNQCNRLFYNAYIYLPSTVTQFDLTNVTSCARMFYGCRLYKISNESNHTYVDTDRKFVSVRLPDNCSLYDYMFYNSSVLTSLPAIRSSSTSDVPYMFGSCVMGQNGIIIPADYFNICKSKLKTTNFMFYNNQYIAELEYSNDHGLLQDCVSLATAESMFQEAHFLHKGIPSNIFGTSELQNLTSLKNMFKESLILYDISSENKCIDSNTFSPLIKLTSIEGMFEKVRRSGSATQAVTGYSLTLNQSIQTAGGSLKYIIDESTFTFKKIDIISKSFKSSNINIPFKFKGFISGIETFHDSRITSISNDQFVDNENLSSIVNITRMFYNPYPDIVFLIVLIHILISLKQMLQEIFQE